MSSMPLIITMNRLTQELHPNSIYLFEGRQFSHWEGRICAGVVTLIKFGGLKNQRSYMV